MTAPPPGHRPDDERRLHTVLWSLRDYLGDLIVVGGWVPQLYRRYGGLRSWRSDLSRTTEVDVVVSDRVPRSGRQPISEALETTGFAPVDPGPSFAIWKRGDTADQVEFLIAHAGPARAVGSVRPVKDQEPLGAIQLPDLEMLARFTRVLEVPLETDRGSRLVSVKVPTLGAFLVSRGAILHRRPSRAKNGKDLLYIHDVMTAGDDVVAMVTSDVRAMVEDSVRVCEYVEYAATHVGLAVKGERLLLTAAVGALAERSGADPGVARQTLKGYLTDYVELLREQLKQAGRS